MLVEHRVHDVNERFVTVEEAVSTGEEVPLQPSLALVLGKHLHHPAVGRQVVVTRPYLGIPGPVGDLEHVLQPVRCGLVRSEEAEGGRIGPYRVPEKLPEPSRRLVRLASWARDGDRIVTKVG